MKLVLDHAVLDAAALRLPQQRARLRGGRRHRLFAIDMLAGGDRLLEDGGALLCRRRIEKDRVSGIGERRVEIGGPIRELVGARDRGKAVGVAADEQQTRKKAFIAECEPALFDDRD
jgi:hypothetical protein